MFFKNLYIILSIILLFFLMLVYASPDASKNLENKAGLEGTTEAIIRVKRKLDELVNGIPSGEEFDQKKIEYSDNFSSGASRVKNKINDIREALSGAESKYEETKDSIGNLKDKFVEIKETGSGLLKKINNISETSSGLIQKIDDFTETGSGILNELQNNSATGLIVPLNGSLELTTGEDGGY